jgi:exodeoxyribonuclease VII small subunit
MSEQEQNYQQSMMRLEEILEQIDDNSTGIDELASMVEEASAHLKICRGILRKTEKQVQTALEELSEEDTE